MADCMNTKKLIKLFIKVFVLNIQLLLLKIEKGVCKKCLTGISKKSDA